NLLRWNTGLSNVAPDIKRTESIGDVWFIGGGSVASAVAYFLVLAGLSFEATIFDGDIVEIENLDRSPIFRWDDEGESKATVVATYLRNHGILAHAEPTWLDGSQLWKNRQQGKPDLLVSAANERNVRYAIETGRPPAQI